MIYSNPPIHVGQRLTSRSLPHGAKPDYEIVDFITCGDGCEWFVEPINPPPLSLSASKRRRLALSEVYAEFKFEN